MRSEPSASRRSRKDSRLDSLAYPFLIRPRTLHLLFVLESWILKGDGVPIVEGSGPLLVLSGTR